MGQKIVAMIDEDPDIEALCKRIDERKHFAKKRIQDFEKQLKEVNESLEKANKEDWESLASWLKDKNRLPSDFNKQTHYVSFNLQHNGIAVGRSNGDESNIKNVGSFCMDDLPPDLKKAMIKFLEGLHE